MLVYERNGLVTIFGLVYRCVGPMAEQDLAEQEAIDGVVIDDGKAPGTGRSVSAGRQGRVLLLRPRWRANWQGKPKV